MNGNTVNQLITRQEAAHILKVSDAGVAFLTKRGDLSEVRFSKRRVLYDKQLVRRLAYRRGTFTTDFIEFDCAKAD